MVSGRPDPGGGESSLLMLSTYHILAQVGRTCIVKAAVVASIGVLIHRADPLWFLVPNIGAHELPFFVDVGCGGPRLRAVVARR